jgi:hypothetical protein
MRTSGGRVVGHEHARGDELRVEHVLAGQHSGVKYQRRQRRIGHRTPAVDNGVARRRCRRLARVLMMLVRRRGLSMMMVLRIALVSVAHLAHDAVIVAQHEWRGGKSRHLAGQPDRRHEPDVRADTHHSTEYVGVSSTSRARALKHP